MWVGRETGETECLLGSLTYRGWTCELENEKRSWVVDVYLEALHQTGLRQTHTHTVCCDTSWLNPPHTSCNPLLPIPVSPHLVHGHALTYQPQSCLLLHTPLTLHVVPTCHLEPHPFQCPALSSRRYVAACAPHIQEWLFYPPLRGSYDYVRLTRDNHLPNPSWLYSQGLSTVWDAKVGLGAGGGRQFWILLKHKA